MYVVETRAFLSPLPLFIYTVELPQHSQDPKAVDEYRALTV